TGARAIAAAFLQHGSELRPRRFARMLAAELALAVAPARCREHGRDARVDAAAMNRDRGAEARSHHGDALAVDAWMLRKQRERIARRGHLVGAKEQPLLACALAATRHVEAHADVAELLEDRGRPHHVVGGHAAAETVQDDEGWPPLAGLEPFGDPDHAGELEAFGGETDAFFRPR